MSKCLLVLLACFLIITENFPQNYFPLEVGNSWTFINYVAAFDKRTFVVKDSLRIGSEKYFLYGLENSFNDTIRNDNTGRVWKYKNGVDLLWLDFTKDSGEVYEYIDVDTNEVTVRRNIQVETKAGAFSDCIELFFNVPYAVDDEIAHTFAPNIGPVMSFGAWFNEQLFSAIINNIPVSVEKESPFLTFKLDQNYPNPFNPATVISYQLSVLSHATLKVYDLLGNEVAALVNEQKQPGFYKVIFNGNHLSSGVYFYRLDSGKYSQTNKMILLR